MKFCMNIDYTQYQHLSDLFFLVPHKRSREWQLHKDHFCINLFASISLNLAVTNSAVIQIEVIIVYLQNSDNKSQSQKQSLSSILWNNYYFLRSLPYNYPTNSYEHIRAYLLPTHSVMNCWKCNIYTCQVWRCRRFESEDWLGTRFLLIFKLVLLQHLHTVSTTSPLKLLSPCHCDI